MDNNSVNGSDPIPKSHEEEGIVDDGEGEIATLIYEDEGLRQEYDEAREWLENLTPSQILKPALFDHAELQKLANTYKNNKPYPHLVIEDFIDGDILEKIADEIRGLEWKAKNNDLYLFHQSKLDLKTARRPLLKKLCQVLYSDEFVAILKTITGLPLFAVRSTAVEPSITSTTTMSDVDTINSPLDNHPDFTHAQYSEPDMFAAVYGDTCRLLCHDDELEGRRIAYIIYLSKEWRDEWGGHLDLFNHTEVPSKHGKSFIPTTISKSYCPRFAQFAFFEVGETSYHQVREVHRQIEPGSDENDETGQRFSISGWYHGPHIVRQNDEYVPSSAVQIPPQNATTMRPVVNESFNQSGFTTTEVEQINQRILQNLIESKSIISTPTPTAPAVATKGTKKATGPAIETKTQIEDNITFWVNKTYLAKTTQKQVMQRFETESCLDLVNFIKPSIYNQMLLECWQFEQCCFGPVDPLNPTRPACDIAPIADPIEYVGPCNLRAYYRYNPANIIKFIEANPNTITALPNGKESSLIYKFHQFLHSKSFFTAIGMFTGMKAISSSHELQLFRPGCYTLAHDNDPEAHSEGLDVTFSLWASNDVLKQFAATVGEDGKMTKPPATTVTTDAVKKIDSAWEEADYGGTIHYLQAGEDDELLTVSSPSNTLSLVYRAGDDKIFQFQRYIDHTAPGSLYRFRGMMKLDD